MSATVTGLTPETTYSFYIVAKDAAGNKSANSDTVQATTDKTTDTPDNPTTCGTEDFENIPAQESSYKPREWSNRGIIWKSSNARTDKDVYIDGTGNRAICVRKGNLISSEISGGIQSLSVRTYLRFNSDSEGSYTLKINGEEKGKIPYSKNKQTFTINNINVSGKVVIELVDNLTNNRVSFDNLSWTCYSEMATGETKGIAQKLIVYPNPVKNNLFYINGISNNETLLIYNLNGQLVQTINHVDNKSKVNLQKLPKGTYIVKTKNQATKILVD